MKITCRLSELTKEVSNAVSFASTKNSLSMTSCVKIVAENDSATILATDGKMCFKATINACVEECGELAVFADKLHAVLKNIKSEEIRLTYEPNKLEVTAVGDTHSKINIKTLDATKFPKIVMPKYITVQYTIKKALLESMLDAVSFAASTDSSPIALTGVCMECVDGELRFVATNRRMMALVSAPTEVELLRDIKIPVKFCNAIKSLDADTVTVIYADSEIYVCTPNCFISSPLITGMFPNYMKVIPSGDMTEIHIDVEEFLYAVNLVSIMSNSKENKIYMSLSEGSLVVYGSDDNYGDSRQLVDCDYKGEETITALNSKLLYSVLKSIPSKKATVSFKQPDLAWKFVPEGMEDLVYIIMPMKV